jgi:hypothetical protein
MSYRTCNLEKGLYGSHNFRRTRRITAAEMKYMRKTAGYIWTDYKTNAQIAKN